MMRVADSSARLPDLGGQRQAVRVGHAGVEQHQRVRPAAGGARARGRPWPPARRPPPPAPSASRAATPPGCAGWWRCRRRPAPAGRGARTGGWTATGSGGCGWRPNRAVKAKVLPRPGSLSTVIVPPIRATSRAAMVRPRPVPPYLRVVEVSSCSKARKIALLLVRRDADAGVAHGEAQADLALGRGLAGDFHAHDHLALLGELDGVAHQVEQDLPQPAGVADQGVGHVRLHVADQLQPLLVGPHGQRPQGVADRRPQREVGRVQLQLAGLDLGEVEQVVDDAEQAVGRRLDRLQALPLVLGQRRVEDQLGHAEDGVHGGADLVADVGQELVLGPVGRLRRLLGLPQLLLGLLPVGDVARERPDELAAAFLKALRPGSPPGSRPVLAAVAGVKCDRRFGS